jgi:hypothetical protein
MRRAAWLLLAFAGAAEAAPTEARQPPTVALFSELQDAPPFSAEDMAERQKGVSANDEASAADLALNNWKNCVIESLARWAPLRQGPGTLIDGAYGRCADIEREYRGHLMRITQSGRQVVDVSMARSMTRMLEEAWRNRLTAMALDHDLAALQQPPPTPQQPVAPSTPGAAQRQP